MKGLLELLFGTHKLEVIEIGENGVNRLGFIGAEEDIIKELRSYLSEVRDYMRIGENRIMVWR